MSLSVVLTPQARTQIRSLQRYIAKESYPERARKYIARLSIAIDKLGIAPYQGALREDIGPGVRITGFERRVAILFLPTTDKLFVIGIFYGGRLPR